MSILLSLSARGVAVAPGAHRSCPLLFALWRRYKGQIGVARTAEGLIHVWGIPVGLALLAASICLGFAWFGRTRRGQQLMTKATVSVGASDLLRSRNYDGSMEDVYLGSASMNANVGETSPLLDGTH